MKRISCLLIAGSLWLPTAGRAQDAATQERIDQLRGKVEDLIAGQETQQKRISELTREIADLREQQNKPTPVYASQDDLKRLSDALKEIDRKRLEDNDKIRSELQKLVKTLATPAPAPAPAPKRSVVPAPEKPSSDVPATPEKGFEYVVKKGDTLSGIVQGCRDQNIKVTQDQVKKANPKLKPEKMHVGQKIFIPAPES
jgi:LysM repeat protein